ncbi:N-acetylmuramoyl-L-alanine amidase [Caloranaerobacter azorensis H53214]|uniref:N-acetylmuramoyl-L-alanine amidase n=2 Tax=Caloranaerobacter azorensis TaxID=116090 RepID=A0A1M5U010_9FIRM|nr:N-acetylmuramoyl-L-alanine amidase CwlD [Caloranaerobacter azorensis]KGG81051.1 N-acetylmuramoyl-L-alanine amidase [Caloranaerobacter azorensis H53214]SHH56274.1 N-acetylmuramoyl-L-alanine amidase [Caloranaerobacter azorensis DSM 13643]
MKVIIIKKEWIIVFFLILISLIYYLNTNNFVTTSLYLPINNKVIIIDPGHGGIDPGAVGKLGKKEDDINLEIALKLRRLIEQTGGIAILTREEDKGLYTEKSKTYRQKKNEDLRNRKIFVNESEGDIFISIHLNSFPQSKYYGAQTFYKKGCEDSKKLAEILQEELRNVLDKNNKRVPQDRDNIYLIREVNIPSVLIECGFISNPNEERLLSDSKYQEKIAWAIYIGIMRYFKEVKNE